jgi:hypothetical protein
LKQRLDEPGVSVRLKSQYSSRLYQWAKPYLAVGYKRVSLATLRKVLGLEEIKDNSGRGAQLELWANVKQRAFDQALKEINKHSDIQLELEFTGRGPYRKVKKPFSCQQWPNFRGEDFVFIFLVKQIGRDRSEALEQQALRVKLR